MIFTKLIKWLGNLPIFSVMPSTLPEKEMYERSENCKYENSGWCDAKRRCPLKLYRRTGSGCEAAL